MKKIFISKIPVRRKMVSVSPANNILIIYLRGKTSESHQQSVKVEFSPSYCSNFVPFSLSLVEERDQVLTDYEIQRYVILNPEGFYNLNIGLKIKGSCRTGQIGWFVK